MHLAINLRTFVAGEIGGMENYVVRILAGIAARQHTAGEALTVFAAAPQMERLARLAPAAEFIAVGQEAPDQAIEAELARRRCGLLFCPLLVLEPLRPRLPSAVTIPDVQHEFFPDFFDSAILDWRRAHYRASASRARIVFTFSEFSKSTLVQKLAADPGKVVVVGLDAAPEFDRPASPGARLAFQSLSLPSQYLYLPANFWPHKNHAALLRALQLLVNAGHPDLHLVLTGAVSPRLDSVLREAAALGLRDRVRFAGYPGPEVVAEIYRHSRALPFVSRFEGFGIPLLEAFRTGTPVIASRSTSCPEVAGDAALFVDETDPRDIAAALDRVLADEALRRDLVRKGARRAALYSWDRAIEVTWEGLQRAPRSRPAGSFLIAASDPDPLITVVTPSYNQGRFIRATLESVLSQDYPHLEYIVMDGGSTDETAAVVSEYSSRVRWISEKDRGQSHAINKGFRMAAGDVVSWLNSDDVILPGALRLAVQAFRRHPAAGVVYGDGYQIDIDGNIRQKFPCTEPFNLWKLVHLSDYILQQSTYFRREVLEEVGYIDEDLHYGLDWDLFIRIGKRYEMAYIPRPMGSIREYADAKSFAGGAKRFAELAAILRRHTATRYPPGYFVYGLDTYIPIWCKRLRESLPPGLARLGQDILHFVGGNIIAQVSQRSQGLYPDRWAAPKLKYMLSPGSGVASIRGVLPELAPSFRDQEIEITCNGKPAGSFRIPPGEFHIKLDVRSLVNDDPATFILRASRFTLRDYRRLSYRLESFEWL